MPAAVNTAATTVAEYAEAASAGSCGTVRRMLVGAVGWRVAALRRGGMVSGQFDAGHTEPIIMTRPHDAVA
jgi:hypothetical protein